MCCLLWESKEKGGVDKAVAWGTGCVVLWRHFCYFSSRILMKGLKRGLGKVTYHARTREMG